VPLIGRSSPGTPNLERARSWVLGSLPEIMLGIGLTVQVLVLVVLARGRWFVGDDWDFLMTRGTIPGHHRGWFTPHAEHWSTGVIAIYRALFSRFGMRDYLPYGLVVIVLHVAICITLYVLLLRVGAARWPAAITLWVIVFLGSGAEALLWDTPMNLQASLLLAMIALCICARPELGQRRIADAWVLLTLGLTFSGAGITGVAVVAAYVALRHGLLLALRVASVPTVVFLLWFAVIGREGSQGLADNLWDYTQMPLFVWTGLTHALGATSGIPGAGAALLLGLVAVAVAATRIPRTLRDLALAGIAAAALQLTLAASTPSRLDLLDTWAVLGRYAYLTMVMLAPVIAVAVTLLLRRVTSPPWVTAVVGGAILAMVAVNGLHLEHEYYASHREEAKYWPDRLLGIVESVDDGERILTTTPANWFDKGVDPRLVVTPQIRKALPQREATANGRLDAEHNYFVGVREETYGLFNPARMKLPFGWGTPVSYGKGCGTYEATATTPVLELQTDLGNEIGVFSDSTQITTQLVRGEDESPPRTWKVRKGTVHIASSARGAKLVVTFNSDGDYLICKH
jgi:hypothetical protein